MTRKEQLKAIPYPVKFGQSVLDKQAYALAVEVAEHLQTVPKNRTEAEEMKPSLPRRLQWAYDRGAIQWSMVKYLQDKLREMEAEDQPISPGSAA